MPKKKKKKKKIKKSSAFKSLRQIVEEDAGKGLENFNKTYKTNVFEEAYKVKDYKQLERFMETYAPGMSAADVAIAAGKYAKENWNIYKIAKDPDHHGAVFELLDEIDKKKGGAVEVWKRWKNNPYFHRGLSKFAYETGYKVPRTDKTFQEQVTMFKKYFKLNRKKKKVAQFLDKEFKI